MKKYIVFICSIFWAITGFSASFMAENQVFQCMDEKLFQVEKIIASMTKNPEDSVSLKNQFVTSVTEKNQLLQEVVDVLISYFLMEKVSREDKFYEEKLISVHNLLQWIQVLKETPSLEALRKMKSELSRFKGLVIMAPFKKEAKTNSPKKIEPRNFPCR